MAKSICLADIRRVAPAGVIVFDDKDCHVYRADTPTGFCWEDGLHGYVAPYDGTRSDRAEARADLFERVKSSTLEPCSRDKANCYEAGCFDDEI